MKRARRKLLIPSEPPPTERLQDVVSNRAVRILSFSAVLLLAFNLAVIPMMLTPRKPKIGSKDAVRISGIVRDVLQEYNIETGSLTVVDTLTEVPIAAEFPFYNFYSDLRTRLKKSGAEILECKKIRSSLTLMSVGRRGVAIEHFLFKPRRISRASTGNAAIIIDDFGYSFNKMTRDFLTMDAPLTISIIPGLDNSQKVADAAGVNHKEIIVHMPMEPLNEPFKDHGYILLCSHDAGAISMRIRKAFAEMPGANGLNNHQGSKATADERVMKNVMVSLKSINKYFIDSYTSTGSLGYRTARQNGVRCSRNELFIDAKDDPAFIKSQLTAMVQKAKKDGQVIVIGHARKNTLNVLNEMLPKIKAMGVTLVSASQLVH
jgi:polysaccharide deacetylase 2 family uncharacterized protein YibQ